ENYKQGDKIAIEGRLEMNTIERDGYKEKRARLVASRLYHVMATDATTPSTAPTSTTTPSAPPAVATSTPKAASAPRNEPPPPTFDSSEDIDNIPF
ncbi:MAG: single-stranded DNA-binding protein, partial [Chamaesiphon sp.]|nr:single-stranded DNA-binding protein [Chamaesiphon sp.]